MIARLNSSPVVSDSSVVREFGRKMWLVSGAATALLPVKRVSVCAVKPQIWLNSAVSKRSANQSEGRTWLRREPRTERAARHLARRANRMAKLVDLEVVGVGGERLFVALQRAVALDAGAGELGAEAEGDVIAGIGAEIVAIGDHVVATAAHELVEIGLAQRLDAELLGPKRNG
jgi:hypothetical protein